MGELAGNDVLIYWLMYCIPALLGMAEQNDIARQRRFNFAWLIVGFTILVVIGFRWKVGADWSNYFSNIETDGSNPFSLDGVHDVGFYLLSYLATRIANPGMIVVTVVSGIIMAIGLVRFSLAQPRPWLAITLCVPYIIMVLGMGYIRQGMAISLIMFGIVDLGRGKILRFSIVMLLAATLHSTSVIFVGLGILIAERNRLLIGLAIAPVAAYATVKTLLNRSDAFIATYVEAGMDSSGTLVRLIMTVLPALILLRYHRYFLLNKFESKIWRYMSVPPIFLLAYYFFSPSSTAVDRLGLYFLPVQVFVASRIPDAFGSNNPQLRRLLALGILLLYAIVHFVWLLYSSHAYLWVPYRLWFFEDGQCPECMFGQA